jgi:organic hydroperoxide reductase OsmC/OhrA
LRPFAHPLYNDMSEHKVTLKWERGGAEFSYQKYPRDHTWSFDGGHTMTATAAPAYLGNPANVDPEEAFVASLSSCHMLTFLAIACKQKFMLDSYEDEAVGHMEKNGDGKMAITRVELRPKITWHGERIPSAEELDKMHHSAHENCCIANSVKIAAVYRTRRLTYSGAKRQDHDTHRSAPGSSLPRYGHADSS